MAEPAHVAAVEPRPNPWITALAASPFAAIVPLLVTAGIVGQPMLAAFTIHLLIAGALATLFARRRNPLPRRVPVDLTVDADGLEVRDRQGGSERVAKDAITRGVKVPTPRGLEVRLRGARGRERVLEVKREADADAILDGLGLDVRHTAATFRAMARTHASTWRIFATILGVMLVSGVVGALSALAVPAAAPIGTAAGLFGILALLFWPTRVEVGGDGVLLRWLGRDRFMRHADIAHVDVRVEGFGRSKRNVVVLTLRSGEIVKVPTGSPAWDGGNARTLAARIVDAGRAAASGGVEPGALLLRGERAHRDWVAALRKREITDLRSPAVPRDVLFEVIEDAAADALDRAAAVVALGPALSGEDRGRLAQAAKVIAAPKLRVVLEQSADADEDELARMLEELEADAPSAERARRRR